MVSGRQNTLSLIQCQEPQCNLTDGPLPRMDTLYHYVYSNSFKMSVRKLAAGAFYKLKKKQHQNKAVNEGEGSAG